MSASNKRSISESDSNSSECGCGSCPEVLSGEELIDQTLEELDKEYRGQTRNNPKQTTSLRCRFPFHKGDYWQIQSQLIGVSRLNFINYTKRLNPVATPVKSLQLITLISICSFKNQISFSRKEIENVVPLLITYLDGFSTIYQTYGCEVIESCFQKNLIQLNCKLNGMITDRIIWLMRFGEDSVKVKLLSLIESYAIRCNNIYALLKLMPTLHSYLICGDTIIKRTVLKILNKYPERSQIEYYYRNMGFVFYINQLMLFSDEIIEKESLFFLNQYAKSLGETIHLANLIDFETLKGYLIKENTEIKKTGFNHV